MNDKSSNPLLFVILTLIIVNLCATSYLIVKDSNLKNTMYSKNDLPQIFTDAELENLFVSIKNNYNSRKLADLYNILSPMVKVQLSFERFEEQLSTIYGVIRSIEDGKFSHHMFLGNQGGMDSYELNYVINILDSNGNKGKGLLKFTITYNGRTYSVVSFYLLKV